MIKKEELINQAKSGIISKSLIESNMALKEIKDKLLIEMAETRANKIMEKVKEKKILTLKTNDFKNLLQRLMKESESAIGLDTHLNKHKESGTINKKNIEAVNKKMKDYLKTGSKGEYNPNQPFFPKGNGELNKMNKKARVNSPEEEEFIDDFKGSGMENLDYDVIKPDEEKIKQYIEGSGKTGNSPEYGNAVKTDVNKKINKRRIRNSFSKEKKNSYKRVPQPIINAESKEKEKLKKLVKEEIKKFNEIISYNKKTQ